MYPNETDVKQFFAGKGPSWVPASRGDWERHPHDRSACISSPVRSESDGRVNPEEPEELVRGRERIYFEHF